MLNKKIKLQQMLIQKEMLMYELADKTNISTVQLSRIINGKSDGTVKWWRKAAEVLECKIGEIIQ